MFKGKKMAISTQSHQIRRHVFSTCAAIDDVVPMASRQQTRRIGITALVTAATGFPVSQIHSRTDLAPGFLGVGFLLLRPVMA